MGFYHYSTQISHILTTIYYLTFTQSGLFLSYLCPFAIIVNQPFNKSLDITQCQRQLQIAKKCWRHFFSKVLYSFFLHMCNYEFWLAKLFFSFLPIWSLKFVSPIASHKYSKFFQYFKCLGIPPTDHKTKMLNKEIYVCIFCFQINILLKF